MGGARVGAGAGVGTGRGGGAEGLSAKKAPAARNKTAPPTTAHSGAPPSDFFGAGPATARTGTGPERGVRSGGRAGGTGRRREPVEDSSRREPLPSSAGRRRGSTAGAGAGTRGTASVFGSRSSSAASSSFSRWIALSKCFCRKKARLNVEGAYGPPYRSAERSLRKDEIWRSLMRGSGCNARRRRRRMSSGTGVPSTARFASSTDSMATPGGGARPVSDSKRIAPTEYRSPDVDGFPSARTSGAT